MFFLHDCPETAIEALRYNLLIAYLVKLKFTQSYNFLTNFHNHTLIPSFQYHIDLTAGERSELQNIVKKRLSTSEAVKRSQILLAADRLGDKKWLDSKISEEYKVSTRTVERLRERFVTHGLSVALKGLPRLNLDKKKFDGVVESHLIAARCSTPPAGRSSWTLNLLGDHLVTLQCVESISHESVRQMLKKTKLSHGL
jgi:hypothetical protein